MLTSQQLHQFQQADLSLDALTVDQVLALIKQLGPDDSARFVEGVFEGMAALLPGLFDVSALLASSMYETAREQADARGRFSVDLPSPLAADQVVGATRWALGPTFGGKPDALQSLPDRLAGSATRLVRDGGRRTVVENAERDPARPRYQRHLSAASKHCDFCVLLASRGAVYRSEDSAGSGQHWHDHCRCYVTLEFL